MNTIAWLLIAYVVLDRLFTVGWIGRTIDVTPAFAVTSLITGALIVWAIVSLATGHP